MEQGTQMLLLLPLVAGCDWKNDTSGTSSLLNNRYNNHNSPNPPPRCRITQHRKVSTGHLCLPKPPRNPSPFLDGLNISATVITTSRWKEKHNRASEKELREILILWHFKLPNAILGDSDIHSPRAHMFS